MTQLEKTLIASARQAHNQATVYYQKRKAGTASGADYDEYLAHYHSLNGILALAHTKDSGLSQDASQQLRGIEEEHAANYREYAAPNLPVDV